MALPALITSRSNARVKALRAAFSGKASQPGDRLGIEGENLIMEALRSGVRLDTVYLGDASHATIERLSLLGLDPGLCAGLSKDVFSSAVDTASPQGIAATIVIPEVRACDFQTGPGVVLLIESLQDPGNLGTLLRSAEAFGVKQIFVTPATVNPWNPKAVRASAGSVFRVPVIRVPLDEAKRSLHSFGYTLFAAVAASEGAARAMDARLLAPCALMIGNEGSGLSPEALALADKRVNIPCAVESLNAAIAGSTLMYEAMRQNRVHKQGEDA